MYTGKNIVHLPTVKTHGHAITTGSIKNSFGGLLKEVRHYAHKHMHEVLVDLVSMQKELHPGIFTAMDGTVCGNGAGPRTMTRWSATSSWPAPIRWRSIPWRPASWGSIRCRSRISACATTSGSA